VIDNADQLLKEWFEWWTNALERGEADPPDFLHYKTAIYFKLQRHCEHRNLKVNFETSPATKECLDCFYQMAATPNDNGRDARLSDAQGKG
jgi:hypothetical protein